MMRTKSGTAVFILLAAFLCGVFLSGQRADASASLQKYGIPIDDALLKTESAVNDCAGLYTDGEIQSFEEKMREMREEYDCNAVAFIINDAGWDTSELSAPEAVSERCLNLDGHKSTVVLWLNVCRGNRSLYVLGYGSAEWKLRDDDADGLAKQLQDYVKRQQEGMSGTNTLYVEMMNQFISGADKEMRTPYFFLTWWFHLFLGIATGIIVVAVLLRNIGGKMTVTGSTYMNKAFSQVIGRRDIYTHTTTVRTKKSSSSGGSSGGGHSHSSGGGRF